MRRRGAEQRRRAPEAVQQDCRRAHQQQCSGKGHGRAARTGHGTKRRISGAAINIAAAVHSAPAMNQNAW